MGIFVNSELQIRISLSLSLSLCLSLWEPQLQDNVVKACICVYVLSGDFIVLNCGDRRETKPMISLVRCSWTPPNTWLFLASFWSKPNKNFSENLGCHSQELSKEAPFILKPKKASTQSSQSACKKEKQGAKKRNAHLRMKSLLGIPPSNRKQQTNSGRNNPLNTKCKLFFEPWRISLSLSMIWWRRRWRRWRRRSNCTQMLWRVVFADRWLI